MFWKVEADLESVVDKDAVVDIAFTIKCKSLPVDHAFELYVAVKKILPWISDSQSGVQPIHVAETGNGWSRPDKSTDLLYPSRRTKLILRVPKVRATDAEQLIGETLHVSGSHIKVESSIVKPLSTITTLFSRYVVDETYTQNSETVFLEKSVKQLNKMGIQPQKLLCGIPKELVLIDKVINTRSLMIAELKTHESLKLQQYGLGQYRHMGCGMFIPHKDIKALDFSDSNS